MEYVNTDYELIDTNYELCIDFYWNLIDVYKRQEVNICKDYGIWLI